jgi:hypothetical protein
MEKQLKFNFDRISTNEEISLDALSRLKILLDILVIEQTITIKDIKQIVALSKWINDKDIV